MSTFFIIHGVQGSPEENWFPWLKTELEKLGHKIIVPQFPTPEGQTLENWMKVMKEYEKDLTPETIVIGHSLGVPFLMSVIEKHPVKTAYLVAGYHPHTLPKTSVWYECVKTFIEKPFDWEKIRKNSRHFYMYHSDNDPYFSTSLAEDLARDLNTKVMWVKGAGHFNTAAGYDQFELLLEKIKTELE